jgi:hypothetical protein
MLVDIACILSHGHVAPVVVASSAFEELDKQLQAMISSGDTIIALDNQDTDEALESNLLCQMLTQPIVKIRPFGQNQDMLDFPSLAVISVTGNNLAIAKDLTERTLLCSLDAKMEVPGRRKFEFNPVAMAMENRARLVRACLIILRAYVAAGRPPQAIIPMGVIRRLERLGSVRAGLARPRRSVRDYGKNPGERPEPRPPHNDHGAMGGAVRADGNVRWRCREGGRERA